MSKLIGLGLALVGAVTLTACSSSGGGDGSGAGNGAGVGAAAMGGMSSAGAGAGTGAGSGAGMGAGSSNVGGIGGMAGGVSGTGASGTGASGTGASGTGASGTGSSGTGASGTGASGTGASGTGASGTGGGGGTCRPQAEGVFAIKTVIEAWWRDEVNVPPIVDPGRGEITVILMGEISNVQDNGMGSGLIKGCGTILPPFVSWAACVAIQIEFPDVIWDAPTMPTFMTDGMTTGFEPGDVLTLAETAGLVGISLNNATGTWPTPAMTGTLPCPEGSGETCFPDHDDDGNPGITVTLGRLGENYATGGCAGDMPVVFRGAPLDALSALDPNSVRAENLYIGVRTQLAGAGEIGSDCSSGVGDSTATALDSRVFDCVRTDGVACNPTQAGFIDNSAPLYHILAKGASPDPSVNKTPCECPGGCLGAACPLDATPSVGPRSALVRIGDLTTVGAFGGLSCEQARNAAFPAL